MGPDGMHPQVLMEQAYVIVGSLLIIFESSWRLVERTEGWEKVNATTLSKKGNNGETENYRPNRLSLITGKLKKQIILETISKVIKAKKMLESSQRLLTEQKSCLDSLITFYDEMTTLVDEQRTVSIV